MIEQAVPVLIGWLEEFSYLGIFFILLVCGLGVPLPEEPVLIAGGYVAYRGITQLWPTVFVSMAGILLGDLMAYVLGKRYGNHPWLLKISKRFVTLRTLVKARRFLRDHGNKTIFLVRFMPGLRMPTYFLSGSMGVKLSVFFFYDFLAALISVPVSVIAAWYFGAQIEQALAVTAKFRHFLLLFLWILVSYWIWRWLVWRREHKAALALKAAKAGK